MKYDVVVQVEATFATRMRIEAKSAAEAENLAEEAIFDDPGFGMPGAHDYQKDGPGDIVSVVSKKHREPKRLGG